MKDRKPANIDNKKLTIKSIAFSVLLTLLFSGLFRAIQNSNSSEILIYSILIVLFLILDFFVTRSIL